MHEGMDALDLPPRVIVERRHQPDRRTSWRGGRRNTDWTNRPLGAWPQLEAQLMPWRQWFSRLRSASPKH
jgi:hypothetical protein